MSNDKYGNSSSNQGEMESETTDACVFCWSKRPVHTILSIGLCRDCDLTFDCILNAVVERFYTGASPSRPLVAQLCEEQKGVCGICKKRIEPWEPMHLDHIVPLSRGGSNERKNLQAAHAVCNLRKGNRMPYDRGATTGRKRSEAAMSEPGGRRTGGPAGRPTPHRWRSGQTTTLTAKTKVATT